jgi:hypothetical protein
MQMINVRGALDGLAAVAAARRAGPKEIKTIQAAYKSFALAAGDPGEDVETSNSWISDSMSRLPRCEQLAFV